MFPNMTKESRQLLQDFILILVSIYLAIFITRIGLVDNFIATLGEMKYFGVFIAGMFFTSVFTTPPAIAILGNFSLFLPLSYVALVGGLGAVVGDYVIFRFMKDRVSEDFTFLIHHSKIISGHKKFFLIFQTRLFKFFVPFIGALIIASPLPDELAIALLGMAHMDDRVFLPISFVMNTLGIVGIGLVARALFLG